MSNWRHSERVQHTMRRVAAVLLPSAICLLILAVLMVWPMNPRARIDLKVRALSFTLGELAPKTVLEPIEVTAVTLSGFDAAWISSNAVEVAPGEEYDIRSGRFAKSAWAPADAGLVRLMPTHRDRSKLTIEPLDPARPMVLDRLTAAPAGKATLRLGGQGNVSMQLSMQERGQITVPDEVQLLADSCRRDGDSRWKHAQGVAAIRITSHDRVLRFSAAEQPVSVVLSLPSASGPRILATDLPVTALEFIDQGVSGAPESTVVAAGTVSFSGYNDSTRVPVSPRDFVHLDNDGALYLQEIALVDGHSSFHVVLEGDVRGVRTGRLDQIYDRRPSAVDALLSSIWATTMFAVLCWVVPTVVAVRKYILIDAD